jgi:hypothetical protein
LALSWPFLATARPFAGPPLAIAWPSEGRHLARIGQMPALRENIQTIGVYAIFSFFDAYLSLDG